MTGPIPDERTNAPAITIDVARASSTAPSPHRAHVGCTRDEITQAFEYLTNPRVGAATWIDDSRTGIVIISRAQQ